MVTSWLSRLLRNSECQNERKDVDLGTIWLISLYPCKWFFEDNIDGKSLFSLVHQTSRCKVEPRMSLRPRKVSCPHTSFYTTSFYHDLLLVPQPRKDCLHSWTLKRNFCTRQNVQADAKFTWRHWASARNYITCKQRVRTYYLMRVSYFASFTTRGALDTSWAG